MRQARAAALLFVLMLLSWGCQKRPVPSSGKESSLEMSRPELMLIVATERNRYEQIYTSQIWDARVSEDGTTFQDYLLEQIRLFSEDILVIRAMADAYGITLDNGEKEQLRRLAQDYYSQLSAADKAYTGAKEEDVLSLYQNYCLASKTVMELTKDAALEISDNEAKVIQLQQIVLPDRETAREVLMQAQAEGADFAALARANSLEDEIRRELGRGEAGPALEAEAFSLETGEISQVVEEGARFYILKCMNDYDQDATIKRKAELTLLGRDKAFREKYRDFLENNSVLLPDRAWLDISCRTNEETSTTNLFELYQEYFPEYAGKM